MQWSCSGILDCLIETKIHNTALFYPQNRGSGSLRRGNKKTAFWAIIPFWGVLNCLFLRKPQRISIFFELRLCFLLRYMDKSQSRQLKQKPEFLCASVLHLAAIFGRSHWDTPQKTAYLLHGHRWSLPCRGNWTVSVETIKTKAWISLHRRFAPCRDIWTVSLRHPPPKNRLPFAWASMIAPLPRQLDSLSRDN